MMEFKGTNNWRVMFFDESNLEEGFFIEADLPNAEENGHDPRVEVLQEDFGDHNGYTTKIRLADAELIAEAGNVRQQINCSLTELLEQRNELLEALNAITNNIDNWLESGEPADKETSEMLYKKAKQAIEKAITP